MSNFLKIVIAISLNSLLFSTCFAQKWITGNDSIIIEDTKKTKLYDNLHKSASKRSWTKRLYSFLFRNPDANKQLVTNKPIEEGYTQYEKKIVRNIKIITLSPFGTSIKDVDKRPDDWVTKSLNSAHQNTHNFIIYNNLLFRRGDPIDPLIVAESERYLRDQPYINDAMIILNNVPDNDSVDATVIVRDVWSIGFEINNVKNYDKYDFELYDKNIFGMGSEFRLRFIHNADRKPKIGYGFAYKISNVFSTFSGVNVSYLKDIASEHLEASIIRPYQITKKYFGEIGLLNNQDSVYIHLRDSTMSMRNEQFSVTIGRSFKISRKPSFADQKLSLAVRYIHKRPISRFPDYEGYMFYPYERSNMYLSAISLFKQQYYKNTMIHNFGTTEDVAYGYNITGQVGFENHAYFNRMYTSIDLSKSKKYSFGYLYTEASWGSFFRNKKNEQGVFRMYAEYFTPLLQIGRSFHRQFLSIDYTQGIKRLDSEKELIYFSSLSTFKTSKYEKLAQGHSRFMINLENDWFTPISIIGFRPVVFSFINLGWLSRSNLFHQKNFVSGYGVGLRLRNENLVFKTLEIKLAWYPNFPQVKFTDFYHFTTSDVKVSSDFKPKYPEVLPFY